MSRGEKERYWNNTADCIGKEHRLIEDRTQRVGLVGSILGTGSSLVIFEIAKWEFKEDDPTVILAFVAIFLMGWIYNRFCIFCNSAKVSIDQARKQINSLAVSLFDVLGDDLEYFPAILRYNDHVSNQAIVSYIQSKDETKKSVADKLLPNKGITSDLTISFMKEFCGIWLAFALIVVAVKSICLFR